MSKPIRAARRFTLGDRSFAKHEAVTGLPSAQAREFEDVGLVEPAPAPKAAASKPAAARAAPTPTPAPAPAPASTPASATTRSAAS